MSFALARPAKQGTNKEERQLRGTEQGMLSCVSTCEGMEGGGGEGRGQGMFEVWCKESKCERHTTKRSVGQEKPLDNKNKCHTFFATMATLFATMGAESRPLDQM